jgi:hypothetical protein
VPPNNSTEAPSEVARLKPKAELEREKMQRVLEELNAFHQAGNLAKMLYVRYDAAGEVYSMISGNVTLQELTHAIACLEQRVRQLMDT